MRLYRGGDGPQLLFLHDPFCPSWLPLHEQLAAHYEVLVPLHPGFAGSEEGFEQFETMEDLVFHYLDLCAVLRLDRPVLAGASFGGWIAAEWAMRYSDSLSKLILIDALGLRVPEAPAADILSLDPAARRQRCSVIRLRRWHWKHSGDAQSRRCREYDSCPADLGTLRLAIPRQSRDCVGISIECKVPTMILWGERDGVVSVAHGKAYHEGIAGSKLVVVQFRSSAAWNRRRSARKQC